MPKQPWDRQRDEDNKPEPNLWFDRFQRFYLFAGPERSFLAAYNAWRQEVGKGGRRTSIPNAWEINTRKWNWSSRAEQYDTGQRSLRVVAEEQARHEMLRRHAKQAQALQALGSRRLQLLSKDVAELSPPEARHYIGDGTKLERQALGLPEHLLQIATMTEEQLAKELDDILTSLGAGADHAQNSGAESGDDKAGDSDTEVSGKGN